MELNKPIIYKNKKKIIYFLNIEKSYRDLHNKNLGLNMFLVPQVSVKFGISPLRNF